MEKNRSRVIIKNEFQHKLIMSTLLITLITLNIIIMCAFVMDDLLGSDSDLINMFSLSVAIMELLAVVVVYYIGRRISFRIAGPVYAFERTLHVLEQGDLTQELKLRPGDHFTEVTDALNVVMSSYRERLARARALAMELAEQHPGEQSRELQQQLAWFVTERE